MQLAGGGENFLQVVVGFFSRVFNEHLGVTDDAVDRRGQLVAYVRDERRAFARRLACGLFFVWLATHALAARCNSASIFSNRRGNSIGLVS